MGTDSTSLPPLPPLPPRRPTGAGEGAQGQNGPNPLRPSPETPSVLEFNETEGITKSGDSRSLTSGEITMAQKYYKNSITYSKIKIHNKYYSKLTKEGTAVTLEYDMYWPDAAFREDYSTLNTNLRAWLIHELGHTWQHENKVTAGNAAMGFTGGILGLGYFRPSRKGIPGEYLYEYSYRAEKDKDGVTQYPDLGWYGFEQQCSIIEDYFRAINGGGLKGAVSPYGPTVYDDPQQGLLRYFLEDPKNSYYGRRSNVIKRDL